MSAWSPKSALRAFVRRSQSKWRASPSDPDVVAHAGPLLTVHQANGANRAGFKQTISAEGDCSSDLTFAFAMAVATCAQFFGGKAFNVKQANKDESDRSANHVDALSSLDATRRCLAV